MIVIVTSECSGKARERSQRILDEFLPRIGRRTWSGRITQQGLLRLKDSLARKATTNTSICCQRAVGGRKLQVLWFIGNRKKFNSEGHCAVSETKKKLKIERDVSDAEILCRACCELAALFHDLGKNTRSFQEKLKASARIADSFRHEVVSFAVLKAMLKLAGNDEQLWLERLSERSRLASFIEDSFRLAYNEFRELVVLSRGSLRLIHFMPREESPKFSCVAALVLTHHRLPDGHAAGNLGFLMELNAIMANIAENKIDEQIAELLQLPSGVPLWNDDEWLDEISLVARRLADCKQSDDFAHTLKTVSLYGRTALILGDHKASEIGNTRFPKNENPDPRVVYANTNKSSQALAEPLGSHLRRVRKETVHALDAVFVAREEISGLEHDDIPEDIRYPRTKDSRFEWQAKSARITRKAFKEAPKGSGFFGVLMAGTGSGKTRTAPILATASSQGRALRLNIATGMRSLTLQGGMEYREDMRFQPEDVSVVIGDKLTQELFELENPMKAIGTDSDFIPGDITVQSDLGTPSRVLPREMMRFAGTNAADDKVNFLTSPILVSTVDVLMPAASAMRGNHVIKMLRTCSADLVLDEIDGYCNEDIAALARLVYVTAAFGRNVIISSATVTPEIARAMFHAYQAGWKIHCHVGGMETPILCGWYSEACEPKCLRIDDETAFSNEHLAFAGTLIGKLDQIPPRRKAECMSDEGIASIDDFFKLISREIVRKHDLHCVTDAATGKSLSLGVVRWNNVDVSMLHAKYLLENGLDNNHEVLVVPYNGTLLPVVRHKVESVINYMLKRKGTDDPILKNETIRHALDSRCSKPNLSVVIVTTSMEEVGRDHDFDWGITEPNSLRSLIQISGRIRRHRPGEVLCPNISLMPFTFKELLDILGLHVTKNGMYFAYPGLETPVTHNKKQHCLVKLTSHRTKDVYDLDALNRRVDARDMIGEQPSQKNVLAQKERKLTRQFLFDGKADDSFLSLRNYTKEPSSLLNRYHPKNLRFRRPSGTDIAFVLGHGLRSGYWWRISEDGPRRIWTKCSDLVAPIQVDTGRLLIEIEDEECLAESLASKLWGDDIPEWKAASLLSITKTVHGSQTTFRYHKALGFCEKKDWHERIL